MSIKIVIAANTAWYLRNFRLNLMYEFKRQGYEVVALAPPGDDASDLQAAGIRFVPVAMDNLGTSPTRDIALFLRLLRVLRRERPDVFLGYTVKPNIYGGFVCQLLRIRSVHNVTGLGTAFIKEAWLTRVVRGLYRFGLRRAATIFFQNRDDLELFKFYRLVPLERTALLPGSGVETSRFMPIDTRVSGVDAPFRFLLSARLLWDKGIGEFVAAARQLKMEGTAIECWLLGFLGTKNRSAITREQIDSWEAEGVVKYFGTAADVRPVIGDADCVVLPSYREGTPRSLLEAASMAKPVITTDAVGCREAVDDGVTGYLCEPRNADDLADKMRRMMQLSLDERLDMGRRGREKMLMEFDEQIVIDRYLSCVQELTGGKMREPANLARRMIL